MVGPEVALEKVYVFGELPDTSTERAWDQPDESGRFVLIVDPEKGPYRVRAGVYGERGVRYEKKQEGVPAGQTGITLELGPAASND